MDGGTPQRLTVEEVVRDFKGRRAGVIKALTADAAEFFEQCDPENENLCLYGRPNGQWEVTLPAQEVPSELPEPTLGINFSRDGMLETDWLSLVAVHSDAWLLSVAYYFGARFGFDKADRKRLFDKINDLPTVYEIVSVSAKKQAKENAKARGSGPAKNTKRMQPDDMEYHEEGYGDTLCGACGENYASDEFWIGCDICEKWFHGKCVKITPARAQHIEQYKCPSCSSSNKRMRP